MPVKPFETVMVIKGYTNKMMMMMIMIMIMILKMIMTMRMMVVMVMKEVVTAVVVSPSGITLCHRGSGELAQRVKGQMQDCHRNETAALSLLVFTGSPWKQRKQL